jgi:DtxR family Mn-dependent transcriptional regulator
MAVSQGAKPRRGRKPSPTEPQATGRLSRAAENYLLSMAILWEDGVSPHIGQLAAYLRHIPPEEEVGTTLASVSGMVHRLANEGLMTIDKNKEVQLTDEGRKRALHIVRRHRLAERLLVNLLDVPLERAEIEAHQLEHSISPRLLERIEEKLGFPTTCPFGRPIYGPEEPVTWKEPPGVLRLDSAKNGATYQVVRIPDEDYALLCFLVENRILPDEMLLVQENAPYRGVVDLERNGNRVSIGRAVAARIRVRPA